MSNKKQTAVEYLFNQIKKDMIGLEFDYAEDLNHAKEMEKQQIIDSFEEGKDIEYEFHINDEPRIDAEQYYKETFKK
jgi:hypothetical protein